MAREKGEGEYFRYPKIAKLHHKLSLQISGVTERIVAKENIEARIKLCGKGVKEFASYKSLKKKNNSKKAHKLKEYTENIIACYKEYKSQFDGVVIAESLDNIALLDAFFKEEGQRLKLALVDYDDVIRLKPNQNLASAYFILHSANPDKPNFEINAVVPGGQITSFGNTKGASPKLYQSARFIGPMGNTAMNIRTYCHAEQDLMMRFYLGRAGLRDEIFSLAKINGLDIADYRLTLAMFSKNKLCGVCDRCIRRFCADMSEELGVPVDIDLSYIIPYDISRDTIRAKVAKLCEIGLDDFIQGMFPELQFDRLSMQQQNLLRLRMVELGLSYYNLHDQEKGVNVTSEETKSAAGSSGSASSKSGGVDQDVALSFNYSDIPGSFVSSDQQLDPRYGSVNKADAGEMMSIIAAVCEEARDVILEELSKNIAAVKINYEVMRLDATPIKSETAEISIPDGYATPTKRAVSASGHKTKNEKDLRTPPLSHVTSRATSGSRKTRAKAFSEEQDVKGAGSSTASALYGEEFYPTPKKMLFSTEGGSGGFDEGEESDASISDSEGKFATATPKRERVKPSRSRSPSPKALLDDSGDGMDGSSGFASKVTQDNSYKTLLSDSGDEMEDAGFASKVTKKKDPKGRHK